MSKYGDFSSLLQLGVGIGIGLSVFRAPVLLKVARLQRIIEGELIALDGVDTQFAKNKRRNMQDINISFLNIQQKLDLWQFPFMVAAVIGAIINTGELIRVTLDVDRVVSDYDMFGFLFFSVGFFAVILVFLELMARFMLRSVQKRLLTLQKTRAI